MRYIKYIFNVIVASQLHQKRNLNLKVQERMPCSI